MRARAVTSAQSTPSVNKVTPTHPIVASPKLHKDLATPATTHNVAFQGSSAEVFSDNKRVTNFAIPNNQITAHKVLCASKINRPTVSEPPLARWVKSVIHSSIDASQGSPVAASSRLFRTLPVNNLVTPPRPTNALKTTSVRACMRTQRAASVETHRADSSARRVT